MRLTLCAALAAFGLLTLSGCHEPGPAEKAGASVDRAARGVGDAIDPPKGPAASVGRSLDRATGN
jgi:hypothetical protein